MTPYYDHAGVTIYHGDAREIVPQLDEYTVVVTDPPWKTKKLVKIAGSDRPEALLGEVSALWGKAARAVVVLGDTSDQRIISAVRGPGEYLRCGVIERVPPSYRGSVLSLGWIFHVFGAGFLSGNGHRVLSGHGRAASRADDRFDHLHPASMSIEAAKWLIAYYTRPADCVLDPFMGTGAIVVAAKYGGREAIGIEICEAYCEIAARRCRQEVLPFDGAPSPRRVSG